MSTVGARHCVNPGQLQIFRELGVGFGRDMLLLVPYQGNLHLGSDPFYLLVEQRAAMFHAFPKDGIN